MPDSETPAHINVLEWVRHKTKRFTSQLLKFILIWILCSKKDGK